MIFHRLAVAQADVTSNPLAGSRDHGTLIASASARICTETVLNVSPTGSQNFRIDNLNCGGAGTKAGSVPFLNGKFTAAVCRMNVCAARPYTTLDSCSGEACLAFRYCSDSAINFVYTSRA